MYHEDVIILVKYIKIFLTKTYEIILNTIGTDSYIHVLHKLFAYNITS